MFLLTQFGNENTRNCINILSCFDTFLSGNSLNLHKKVAKIVMLNQALHFIFNLGQQDYLLNSNLYL